MTRFNTAARIGAATAALLVAAAVFATPVQAASPAWKLLAATAPTHLSPTGQTDLIVYPTNVGGAPTAGTATVTVGPLPAGLETAGSATGNGWSCLPSGAAQPLVTCTRTASTPALRMERAVVVPVRALPGAVSSTVPVSIEDGGTAGPAVFDAQVTISDQPAPHGVQAYWAAAFDADGQPYTQAGGHPHSAGTMFVVNTNPNPAGAV